MEATIESIVLELNEAKKHAANALRLARQLGQSETDIAYPAELATRRALSAACELNAKQICAGQE